MQQINFPKYHFKIKTGEQNKYIFDKIRKKYVALTPEEWVRQHIVEYLTGELRYPAGLIAIEMQIEYNNLQRRCDAVVYNKKKEPRLIIECKAPHIKLTQKTLDQTAEYNFKLNVDFFILTNGVKHICCQLDYHQKTYIFRKSFPDFMEL